MGRRSTKLNCSTCDAEWWEKFEQMSREQLCRFAENTTCPECDSHEWNLTFLSQFSGGPIYPNPPSKMGNRLRSFWCNECSKEFYDWIGEFNPDELRTLANSLSCPVCESNNWKLRDGYKFIERQDSVPRYITVVSERPSEPEDSVKYP